MLKLMFIESVMPSNHRIPCHPLFLLPSAFPSIRVFSNESALCVRWPKYWSFSFSISHSNESSGLISLVLTSPKSCEFLLPHPPQHPQCPARQPWSLTPEAQAQPLLLLPLLAGSGGRCSWPGSLGDLKWGWSGSTCAVGTMMEPKAESLGLASAQWTGL